MTSPNIIATAALARDRVSSNNLMLRLAMAVTQMTVAGRLSHDGVADLYNELVTDFGKRVSSRAPQVSKLRIFYHLGQRFDVQAVIWLRERTERQEGLSRYETIVSEARAALRDGVLA
jgi:hypothetical protein